MIVFRSFSDDSSDPTRETLSVAPNQQHQINDAEEEGEEEGEEED